MRLDIMKTNKLTVIFSVILYPTSGQINFGSSASSGSSFSGNSFSSASSSFPSSSSNSQSSFTFSGSSNGFSNSNSRGSNNNRVSNNRVSNNRVSNNRVSNNRGSNNRGSNNRNRNRSPASAPLQNFIGRIDGSEQSFSPSQSNPFLSSSSGSSSSSSNSFCLAASQCSSVLYTRNELTRSECQMSDGSPGFTCSSRSRTSSSRRPFRNADSGTINIRASGNNNNVDFAIRSGLSAVSNLTRTARSQLSSPRRGTGAFSHARFQRQARSSVDRVGRAGLLATQTALQLAGNSPVLRNSGGGDNSAVNFGPSVSSRQSLESNGGSCSPSGPNCPSFSTPYRTADGSCNSQQDLRYGKSETPFNRILLPDYGDGVDSPRLSVSGNQLPSSRLLSTSLAPDIENPDQRWSLLTMSFGQFIDHDLTHSPVLSNGGQDIDCCSSSSSLPSFCSPIPIPRSDSFFRGSKTCMNLVRSTPAPALDCSIRYREQINQLTHWLDSSNVYGSTINEQRQLRSGRGGQLRTARGPDGGQQILPSDNGESSCTGTCFKAGDSRVNEQPNLSLIHTLFLREHNRVAGALSQQNPNWSDEKIFQESRRIVSAEYQHIVYNEWLPSVLGKQYMNIYGLFPLSGDSFSRDYDTSFDPRITNEFATAGFRFGHSLIPDIINVYNTVGRENNPSFNLRDAFNKPELLRLPGMFDGLVAGLTRDSIQKFDSGFSEDITNHLFDGDRNGMDLIALNIQRGRDHGLPGYNAYRDICGLGRASKFSDFSRQMSLRRTQELQQIYSNVDDVDLFVGMFSERPINGAMVGPTTLCIVGDQFARLKKGDRYFYDLGGQAGSFTQSQLGEVRKASMARLLCDNSGVSQMQPLAFQLPASFNQVQSCDNLAAIPRPNLGAWGSSGSSGALRRG